MKYFYEYKEKNGAIVGGHDLESISLKGNLIVLQGEESKTCLCQEVSPYWSTILNADDIEYLTIRPMGDDDKSLWV